jgi:hypothetical protein
MTVDFRSHVLSATGAKIVPTDRVYIPISGTAHAIKEIAWLGDGYFLSVTVNDYDYWVRACKCTVAPPTNKPAALKAA